MSLCGFPIDNINLKALAAYSNNLQTSKNISNVAVFHVRRDILVVPFADDRMLFIHSTISAVSPIPDLKVVVFALSQTNCVLFCVQ